MQIREFLKWVVVIGAEEFVRNQIPHLLPLYLLAVLVYVSWALLERQPVRAYAKGAYSQLNKRSKMMSFALVFVIGGILLCAFWWSANYVADKIRPTTDPKIEELSKKIGRLEEVFTKSPSVADAAKVPVLQDQLSELSKRKDSLTKQEKEILAQGKLTLDSLEQGRQQYLEKQKIEDREAALTKQKQEIERVADEKKFEERAKQFAAPLIGVVDYAISTFYDKLRDISSEIVTDFPGDRPSAYRSDFLKDGMFVRGAHSVGVKGNGSWGFVCETSGRAPRGIMGDRTFTFIISCGPTIMSIRKVETAGAELSSDLLIRCQSGDKDVITPETCLLSSYQKPIERAVIALIQERYNAAPLPKKP